MERPSATNEAAARRSSARIRNQKQKVAVGHRDGSVNLKPNSRARRYTKIQLVEEKKLQDNQIAVTDISNPKDIVEGHVGAIYCRLGGCIIERDNLKLEDTLQQMLAVGCADGISGAFYGIWWRDLLEHLRMEVSLDYCFVVRFVKAVTEAEALSWFIQVRTVVRPMITHSMYKFAPSGGGVDEFLKQYKAELDEQAKKVCHRQHGFFGRWATNGNSSTGQA